MSHPPFDVVAFDLDGTLADTSGDLAAALNHALGRAGRPELTVGQVRAMVGHGTRELMRKGLAATGAVSEGLIEATLPDLLDFYAANICRKTTAAPGASAALAELRRRGMRVAICTNKPERLTRSLIDALGWIDSFDAIVGGDTLPTKKPDPAMLHAAIARCGGRTGAFVGDSSVDAETAAAAGMPFIAVTFGFLDKPIKALNAARTIDHFDALAAAIASLGRS